MNRDEVIQLIDHAYELRMSGDKAAIAELWAEGAKFHVVGEQSLLASIPVVPSEAKSATSHMVDLFVFSAHRRVGAIVEGLKASVRWEVEVTSGDKPPVRTEILDLWEFTPEGKIASMVQFTDTAMIAQLVS